jgi:selT/selW/selH-like putative selenoprotein
LADKLLAAYEEQISELLLIPSRDGRFEVTCDGKLLFSKAALRRHAQPEEVVEAVKSGQPVTA